MTHTSVFNCVKGTFERFPDFLVFDSIAAKEHLVLIFENLQYLIPLDKQGGFITSLLTSHIKPSSCSTEELCPISWKKRETCSWKLNFDIESFLKHLFSCYILELMNINLISMWGQTPNNELSINEVSIPATFRTRYSQGHALGLWVRNGCLVKPSELQ